MHVTLYFCSDTYELNKNVINSLKCFCIVLFCTDIESTTRALDFRVTVLEENGGDNGNSSVAELEMRVETLEGTATDHETRISMTETDIEGKILKWCDYNESIYLFPIKQ